MLIGIATLIVANSYHVDLNAHQTRARTRLSVTMQMHSCSRSQYLLMHVMHVKTVHGMIINNGLSAMRSRVPLFVNLFRSSVRNYLATVCIVKSNLLWNSRQILCDFKFPLNSGYFQIAADRLAPFISSNQQWSFLSIFRFTVMFHIVY